MIRGMVRLSPVDEDRYNEMKQENPHYLFKEGNGTFYYAATKCKGRFEYADLALHKNKSFLIIPKALHAYFVDGIDPEDFMKANTNVFDYCGGVKIKGDWSFHYHKIVSGEYSETPLQNTIRYYVSNNGGKIVKKNNDDARAIQVEAGKWMQALMIDYEEKEFEGYDINLKYYLEKVRKEIENLEPNTNQLSLF